MRKYTLFIGLITGMALGLFLLLSVGGEQPVAHAAPAVQQSGSAAVTRTVPASLTIPFLSDWAGSPHADLTAVAFTRWNEEDPAEVPVECAKCHSTPGHLDFLGADNSAPGVVDHAAQIGTGVECVACHNAVNLAKTSVVMPSGLELKGLGDESRCMDCHQGRESMISVNNAISETGVTDEDTPSEELGFLNIHYYAAAATKYGTLAKGGYEYESNNYDANFAHVDAFDTCIECHNSHTLQVRVTECKGCHEDVNEVEDLKNIRMAGSAVDYDGDGDVEEGIYYELEGLQTLLYQAMQSYANEVAGTPVVYDTASYPYFFIDTNENGDADADEINRDNRYNAWTARLLKAAYNYQTSLKDPGAFAHGGKYIVQLLHDSLADLNSKLAEPVDLAALHRIDAGHFAGSEPAFRNWDETGIVPGTCSKCHTPTGLPMFLREGTTISQPAANGLECTTCHNDLQEFTRHEVKEVKFPSGAVIDSGDPETNLCMNCHQGRESGASINRLIGDAEADAVTETLRFLNPHYFAAGATRFGADANGAYEYEGKSYVGFFDHAPEANNCIQCHGSHSLQVDPEPCIECHSEVESAEDLVNIRYNLDDWDGDGDAEEGVYYEIDTLRTELYAAIQAYAEETVGTKIVYAAADHPYFYIDTNGNGEPDADEINRDNRYVTWTPRLLRAAYNYQYSGKDPGAFTHNSKYILQVLYDSLEDVGGDVSAMTRPE